MAFDFANFRASNVASNEVLANTTGLSEARSSISKAAPAKRAPAPRKPRAPNGTKKGATAKRARADDDEEVVVRRSTRSRVAKADTQEERDRLTEENDREEEEKRAELRKRKHETRAIEVIKGVTDAGEQDSFNEMIKELAEFELLKGEKEDDGWKVDDSPEIDEERLAKQTEDIELRSIVKIVPERIYSLCVHPDKTKDLVFAGDKYGHIGLWDATGAGTVPESTTSSIKDESKVKAEEDQDDGEEAGDDEAEPSRGKFWIWNAHNKNSVSCIKFRPHDTKKIYSSCYDATLRVNDFESGMSEEVIDGDEFTEDALLHSFDFDPTGNEIWASDGAGGLIWRDLRTKKEEAKRWQIDRAKVGCISINPARPTLAATAHLKREMRIWDLAKLRGLDTELDHVSIAEEAMIVAYPHGKACSSAYFDPSGTRLLSTSYDDALRVWDIDPNNFEATVTEDFEPTEIFSHNCQVGRFVTVLRAYWSPLPPSLSPPHLHVGNMRQTIDLYNPNGVKARALGDAEMITAVPAVTAVHPSVAGRYFGGAANGKVSFWTAPV
ncbi:hypothetical protein JCM10212_003627 [Sporobolomyces blumeae]